MDDADRIMRDKITRAGALAGRATGRLPEPSPPPWVDPAARLPGFYRAIIDRRARETMAYATAGATLLDVLVAVKSPPLGDPWE
jgi:hypothetical protein